MFLNNFPKIFFLTLLHTDFLPDLDHDTRLSPVPQIKNRKCKKTPKCGLVKEVKWADSDTSD